MKLDLKIVFVELFVVIASYMILTMPMAFATNVRIVWSGVDDQIIDYDPLDFITKNIDASGENVIISLSSAYNIEELHVYRCRGYNPEECMSSGLYDTYTEGFTNTYSWNDLADQTSSYPQTANIMIAVKLSDGIGKWF